MRIDALNSHIDIRLSRAQPHIANEHILEDDLRIIVRIVSQFLRPFGSKRPKIERPTLNSQFEGASCLLPGKHNLPFAVGIGSGLVGLFLKGNTDSLASIGSTPNRDGLASLQHHIRLEQLGQLHLGVCHHSA